MASVTAAPNPNAPPPSTPAVAVTLEAAHKLYADKSYAAARDAYSTLFAAASSPIPDAERALTHYQLGMCHAQLEPGLIEAVNSFSAALKLVAGSTKPVDEQLRMDALQARAGSFLDRSQPTAALADLNAALQLFDAPTIDAPSADSKADNPRSASKGGWLCLTRSSALLQLNRFALATINAERALSLFSSVPATAASADSNVAAGLIGSRKVIAQILACSLNGAAKPQPRSSASGANLLPESAFVIGIKRLMRGQKWAEMIERANTRLAVPTARCCRITCSGSGWKVSYTCSCRFCCGRCKIVAPSAPVTTTSTTRTPTSECVGQIRVLFRAVIRVSQRLKAVRRSAQILHKID